MNWDDIKALVTVIGTIFAAIITFSLNRFNRKHKLEVKNLELEQHIKRLNILEKEHELTQKGVELPPRRTRL
ncbi:hypothetical protein [Paenibacillus medicaginis]|uniref:Holin n=1 Tax=Paenibacillus medicaginis TaxID=1470560 RepID=A0ABV5BUV6_9BACL